MSALTCVIDAGTSSVRCGFVSEEAVVEAQAAVPVSVRHPVPGAAEQDPVEIWDAMVAAVRRARVEVADRPVAAITISAQRASVTLLDERRRPVAPFDLWMDTRGRSSLDEIAAAIDPVEFTRITGTPFGPMASLPKLLRLRREDPRRYASARHIAGVADWLTGGLTGGTTTPQDVTCAAWTGLLDLDALDWSAALLDGLGIDVALLPAICRATEPVGGLAPGIASELGIPSGVPVYAGAGDQQCSSAGVGALTIGTASLNLGTSATYVAPARPGDRTPSGMVRSGHVLTGLEDREGTIPVCGSLLNWLTRELRYGEGAAAYGAMIREASEVPAGADGLRFIPTMTGHGTPSWVGASGRLEGLELRHSRAHIVRAALEGLALQFRHVLEVARTGLRAPEFVALAGGGARSAELAQLLADVGRVPLRVPRTDPQHAALVGAAAITRMTDRAPEPLATELYEPSADHEALYDALFHHYRTSIPGWTE